jgi:hypothetical protein
MVGLEKVLEKAAMVCFKALPPAVAGETEELKRACHIARNLKLYDS